jgi:hypothetical protein
MKQFYLAHQLKHRHKVYEIQKQLEYYTGITLLNPFYDETRKEIQDMDKGTLTRYEIPLERCREIVETDLENIKNSDGVICILMDTETLGSYMEIFYASYILDLPVYLISPNEKLRNHVWLKVMCYKIFASVSEFEDYVKANKEEMI